MLFRKYIHIRKKKHGQLNPFGGYTIGYEVSPEEGLIFWSIAKCSNKDRYCKQIGRDIVNERLDSDKMYVSSFDYADFDLDPFEIVLHDWKPTLDETKSLYIKGYI